MLAADAALADALRSSAQIGDVRAVATYQGRQVAVSVFPTGSVTFSGSSEIQASSDVTAYGVGDSLVPKTQTDPLAPFGQELALWRTVIVRSQQYEVPLGVYRIASASKAFERYRDGSDVALDWSVQLHLNDRFEMLKAADFLSVDAPKPGNRVWDEIRRLSLFPVQEALGDADVPPSTVYDNRLSAIETLCILIGGVPHLTREGVLTARRADAWLTETAAAFSIEGVVSWSGGMSNDFFNQVQVKNSNNADITAYAVLDDPWDPLSVQRAGPRTFKQSAPIYVTYAAAKAAADTILARVSTRRARTVTVECTPEALLLELGDVGWVRDPLQRRAVFGEVSGIRVPLDPTATVSVDLIVAVEVPYDPTAPVVLQFAAALFPSASLWPAVSVFPSGATDGSSTGGSGTAYPADAIWPGDSLYMEAV